MKPYFRPRNIVNLSESIDQRLNMYALVASAAGVTPPSWVSSTLRRCSGVTSGWSLFSARV